MKLTLLYLFSNKSTITDHKDYILIKENKQKKVESGA
jgi:hypothetical protein